MTFCRLIPQKGRSSPVGGMEPFPHTDQGQSRRALAERQKKKVLVYELDSPEVKAAIAKSKFKNAPGFWRQNHRPDHAHRASRRSVL